MCGFVDGAGGGRRPASRERLLDNARDRRTSVDSSEDCAAVRKQKAAKTKKEKKQKDKTDKRSKRTEQSTPAESSEQGNDLGWSGGGAAAGALAEQRDAVAHSSQQKIKVVVNQASS